MNDSTISHSSAMFKILILGEAGIGKTSLKVRYTDDVFPLDYNATIGVDYKIKCLKIDDKLVKLSIWDTAGQERYRSVAKSFIVNSHGVLLCFDITDQNSFNALSSFWIKFVNENLRNNQVECKLILVGTKLDRMENRKVTQSQAQNLANQLGVPYFETSAMKNLNINEMFLQLTRSMVESYRPMEMERCHLSLEKKATVKESKRCC